jgi:voltage-gated potassium channel Kch
MLEPGLDKHLWESWWQQFDDDVQTSPAEALQELDGLIAQMLEARGYAIDDPVTRAGDDRDVVADFLAAHEIAEAVDRGKEVDPEDIETAIGNYRELYEFLIEDRAAP